MKLAWDKAGERFYETGVEQGALYIQDGGAYPNGVAWNGLTGVTESPSGAEPTALYANDSKYLSLLSTEEFGATIEAYTYPDEFAQCDGSAEIAKGVKIGQQTRKTFGMAYKTLIGNDVDNNNHGYLLHAIYGAMASPSEKAYATVNDSPEAITFSWEVSTTPVNVTGYKPTASMTIDSRTADPVKLQALENIIYGTDPTVTTSEPADWSTNWKNYYKKVGEEFQQLTDVSAPTWAAATYYEGGNSPRLPLPDEIMTLMADEE